MLHIENKTRYKIPTIPFRQIAISAMEQGFNLSLVFVDNKTMKEINNRYRHKNRPTNILSFLLSDLEGEILMAPGVIKEEWRKLKQRESTYFAYIFIHGLVHLKGFDHGSKMEIEERKIMKKFKKIFESSNFLGEK